MWALAKNAMTKSCCPVNVEPAYFSQHYRRALWIALALNALMFAVEIGASFKADSTSLLADAIDFAGDALNYGLSLGALALGAAWQSRAALGKGVTMAAYGVLVLIVAFWRLIEGSVPEPLTMSAIALIALTVNLGVAVLLFGFRSGNANMRSVWLCTRNDAIGNVAVLAAAAGVFGTGSALPDLAIAVIFAGLALSSGLTTVRQARRELVSTRTDDEAMRRREAVEREIALAAVFATDDIDKARRCLELAHIIGQPQLATHWRSHAKMLLLARRQDDSSEVAAQLLRLALVPIGHLSGRLPRFNPGSGRVGPFDPAPWPAELDPVTFARTSPVA